MKILIKINPSYYAQLIEHNEFIEKLPGASLNNEFWVVNNIEQNNLNTFSTQILYDIREVVSNIFHLDIGTMQISIYPNSHIASGLFIYTIDLGYIAIAEIIETEL